MAKVWIEYTRGGKRKQIAERFVAPLESMGLVRRVVDPEVEISPRTGKPKRQYKRRDMTAE